MLKFMQIRNLHPWDIPVDQALGIQEELARDLILRNEFDEIETIAGAAVAVDLKEGVAHAGVIVYAYPSLVPIEAVVAKQKLRFPAAPGLLSFREAPVLLEAFQRLDVEPDLVFFDGQGVAHPRKLGIASHLGLLLDRPTIGVSTSRLTGKSRTPGPREGDVADLILESKLVGYVFRSKKGALPLYVSPGHRLDFETALKFVRTCMDGYRLPRPIREATALAEAAKKGKPKEFLTKLK